MTGIYDQRSPFSHADPEKFKISKIFPDKQHSKEIKFKDLRLKSEIIFTMHLRNQLEAKLLELLGKAKERDQTPDISISTAMKKLKLLFGKLAIENCSQDYRFAEELSKHWHAMLYQVEICQRSASPPKHLGSLELFIKKLEGHPQKTEYSLGYYLTKYTGEKWIPFPFMDILSSLHENALVKKNKSTLNDWIHTLSYIIDQVK